MKFFCLSVLILLLGYVVNAQDFSYLEQLNIEDKSQIDEVEEAVMECCCYLTGVRFDKKDKQRMLAAQFVSQWVDSLNEANILLGNVFEQDETMRQMYIVYSAMHYLNDNDSVDVKALQLASLKGVINYCSHSSNKLKMTKELKEIDKLIQLNQLEQSIINSRLTSSID